MSTRAMELALCLNYLAPYVVLIHRRAAWAMTLRRAVSGAHRRGIRLRFMAVVGALSLRNVAGVPTYMCCTSLPSARHSLSAAADTMSIITAASVSCAVKEGSARTAGYL